MSYPSVFKNSGSAGRSSLRQHGLAAILPLILLLSFFLTLFLSPAHAFAADSEVSDEERHTWAGSTHEESSGEMHITSGSTASLRYSFYSPKKSIDVSEFNGSIDWASVVGDGVVNAILRIGGRGYTSGGLYTDARFNEYCSAALEAGVNVGVYFFSQAITVEEAIEEANYTLELLGDYEITLPIYIDYEWSGSAYRLAGDYSMEERTAVIDAFCSTVEEAGYTAGIYADDNTLGNYLDGEALAEKYQIWIAHWGVDEPGGSYTGVYDAWQYTSDGEVAGISGRVDMDYLYMQQDSFRIYYWNGESCADDSTKVVYGAPASTLTLEKLGFSAEFGYVFNGWKVNRLNDDKWATYLATDESESLVWNNLSDDTLPEGYEYKLYAEGIRVSRLAKSGKVYFYATWRPAVSEFITYEGSTYYFDETGTLVAGTEEGNLLFTVGEDSYVADSEGKIYFDSIVTVGEDKYYCQTDGTIIKDYYCEIKGALYYFDETGKMAKSTEVTVNGSTYAISAEGRFNRSESTSLIFDLFDSEATVAAGSKIHLPTSNLLLTDQVYNLTSKDTEIATVVDGGYVQGEKAGNTELSINDVVTGRETSCDLTVLFGDVIDSSVYYYEPVYWAYENRITTGRSGGKVFDPSATCTRAEIVTFLWRLAGRPKPESGECVFSDVDSDSYYYKAVQWAYEQRITTGRSSSSDEEKIFDPNGTCTRREIVTFLWRYAGRPAPKSLESKFTDVTDSSAYYYKAVLWAVEQKITTGKAATNYTTFDPLGDCTRGMSVTFIYRYAN